MDIPARIDQLVREHEGLRAAAKATKIDPAYLYRLWRGEKANPSEVTLKKLGLRKKVTYVLQR